MIGELVNIITSMSVIRILKIAKRLRNQGWHTVYFNNAITSSCVPVVGQVIGAVRCINMAIAAIP